MHRSPLVLLLATLLLAASGASASTQAQARVGLHFGPIQKGFPCDAVGPGHPFGCDYPDGSTLDLQGDLLTGYNVLVVVLDIDPEHGVAGLSMGIEYSAPDLLVQAGQLCSDLEFPSLSWPASGTGAVFTWAQDTNCQNTVDATDPQGQAVAVAYAFYTYAYDNAFMKVIARPEESALKVADCTSAESELWLPDQAGQINFGGGVGFFTFDPCTVYPLPVEKTSWGRVKLMYGPGGND
jgi:hypothetical protein